MTNVAATDIRQWLVSARSRGELLATSARVAGIELVMVGVPAGYSAEEVESWLGDLMGMSRETATAEPADHPIPALLHHLLTGLIFSHSELWDRSGIAAPTSMAFVRTAGEVAFGWVNGPAPDLWIDDQPAHVEWVKIRDPEGREACALAIDPAHRIRVHFGFGPAGAPVASVDAVWVPETAAASPGATALETGASGRATSAISRAVGARASTEAAAPAMAEGALASIDVTPPPSPRDGDGWTVVYEGGGLVDPSPVAESRPRPWWAGVTEWIAGSQHSRGSSPSSLRLPDRIPPSPEPAELTARATPLFAAPVAPDEIRLAPLAPEDPSRIASGIAASPVVPAAELQVESVHLDTPVVRRMRPAAAPAAAAAPSPAHAPAPPARVAQRVPAPPAPGAAPVFVPAAGSKTSAAPALRVVAPVAIDADESGLLSVPSRAPRRPRTPDWSEPGHHSVERPVWARPWVWAIFVVVLFLGGWLLGTQNDRSSDEPGGFAKAMRAVGLGGAHFAAKVTSTPPGAWISVDGKDVARRTPATLDLAPGTHQIALSIADLGGATFEVRGVRGDKTALDANLAGSLAVYAGDGSIPVAVTVDGVMRGLAPVTVDGLEPGTHEVRFSGPGLQTWGKTVQVKIHETAQLAARALTSPATGVLATRAQWTDAQGTEELTGATVWIDGEKRGVTPLSLELPRGPHSVRIESRGEQSLVQVIDLPGGNQRFANFELGLGIEHPTLSVLGTPIRLRVEEPTVISAALQGVHATEVRDMWLNVRQPDGAWRRSVMVMMDAPGGVVGTAVLTSSLLDAQGRTLFYVSASSQQGDDYFSEILTAALAAPPPKK